MPRRVKSDIHMQTTMLNSIPGWGEGGIYPRRSLLHLYDGYQLLTMIIIPVPLQNTHSRGEEIWNSHSRMKLRPEQHRLDWWRRGRDRWSRLEDLEDADRVNKKGGKNAPMPAPIGDGFFRLRTFACVVMQKGPDQLQEMLCTLFQRGAYGPSTPKR
jgi:hypothetical protein